MPPIDGGHAHAQAVSLAMWSASRAAVHVEKGRSSTRATRQTFAHSRSSPLSSDCVFGGGTGGTRGTPRRIVHLTGYWEGVRVVPVPVSWRAGTPCPTLRYHPDPPETLRVPPVPLSHLNLEGCRDRTRDSDADRSEFGDGSPADREGPPSQLEPGTGRTQRKWSKFKLTSSYSRRVIRGDQTARVY